MLRIAAMLDISMEALNEVLPSPAVQRIRHFFDALILNVWHLQFYIYFCCSVCNKATLTHVWRAQIDSESRVVPQCIRHASPTNSDTPTNSPRGSIRVQASKTDTCVASPDLLNTHVWLCLGPYGCPPWGEFLMGEVPLYTLNLSPTVLRHQAELEGQGREFTGYFFFLFCYS